MNRLFLNRFCDEFQYPDELRSALNECADAVEKSPKAKAFFDALLSRHPEKFTQQEIISLYEEVRSLAEDVATRKETLELLFYVLLAEPLEKRYAEEKMPREWYHQSMLDLWAKAKECHDIYRFWGTFVGDWFPRFYSMERFAIGRLQYEFVYNPKIDLPGNIFVNVHIPSLGKLDRADIDQSFREATDFYADRFPGDAVPFRCHSWLLNPWHREILSPDSGICQFMDEFPTIEFEEQQNFGDFWRIFNTMDTQNPDNLPGDNTLRRAYKERMKQGLPFGVGIGLKWMKK